MILCGYSIIITEGIVITTYVTQEFVKYILRNEDWDEGPFGVIVLESCKEG